MCVCALPAKIETPWTADIVMGKEYIDGRNNSSPHLKNALHTFIPIYFPQKRLKWRLCVFEACIPWTNKKVVDCAILSHHNLQNDWEKRIELSLVEIFLYHYLSIHVRIIFWYCLITYFKAPELEDILNSEIAIKFLQADCKTTIWNLLSRHNHFMHITHIYAIVSISITLYPKLK